MAVVPLNSSNYSTWKIQCKMALVKEGLWGIVNGSETAPTEAVQLVTFTARKDKALATIVLAVEPKLLYLVGADPTDPAVVWKALADQFQRNTWANKLELKRKLFSMRLAEGGSVRDHIKSLTEVYDELSAIDEPVKEEDRVIYLLASLPECYNVLVTALEASADIPSLSVVTERLLHEETKMKSRSDQTSLEGALTVRGKKRLRCHFCNRPGHFKKDCEEFAKVKEQNKHKKDCEESAKVKEQNKPAHARMKSKMGAFKVTISAEGENSSDSENTGLVVQHAMSADSNAHDQWIFDSGATCHMCNSKAMFSEVHPLRNPINVTLGDGRNLKATGRGKVTLTLKVSHDKTKQCTLHDVLLVPDLAYNLLSVTAASKRGKNTTFCRSRCEIRDSKSKLVAAGRREGSLYYLNQEGCIHRAYSSSDCTSSSEALWHRRLGHLGMQGMQMMAKNQMVSGLDFDLKQESTFCESCVKGKSHRLPFQRSTTNRADQPLQLIHSDVCGKIGTQSLGGGEYFVTFVDDHTRHMWIYILKHKSEVLQRFKQWKALVEKSSGRKVKVLRSDNGGEYTSTEFVAFLSEEGIKHELTIPHTPQQNGIAERLNRTLIESVHTMLADSKLPHKFWAESLSTAVYLRNRSPTKALEGVTPYEAWSGTKPDVSFLRIFGCSAYAHVPRAERRKLDSKVRMCVMLGYGASQKGYRLYDVERMKVIHSRDVVFDETTLPGIEKQDVPKYIELEIEEEPVIEVPGSPVDAPEEVTVHERDEESNETNDTVPEPSVRRSTRNKQQPDRYSHHVSIASSEEHDPSSVAEAKSASDAPEWEKAMEKEMNSLISNDVWELVECPPDRRIVGSKWIFKRKIDEDGAIERYKARVVAQGCSQRFGVDYEETFSPVVRFESIRSVIALGVQHKFQLQQMDVSTAFLHGELTDEVYMRQPEGFVEPGREHLVCRLKRSIYGLKQSPRCWNHALDTQLKVMGFQQTSSDPCLYVNLDSEGVTFLIAVYVDDIILGGKSEAKMKAVKKELSRKFEVKDLGSLHYFLGAKVVQDHLAGVIWMGQSSFVEKILQRFGMQDCKPISTPVNPDVKLAPCQSSEDVCDQQLYQAAVGSLLYLSTKTRPDIAYAVGSVARFCAKPTKEHWTALKRILRYLKGTGNFGLLYSGATSSEMVGYSDADWAGDVTDRRSTSGYVFLLSGAAISWKSNKQTCVALSTAEAEYVALSAAGQEALWLQQLVSDLLNTSIQETTILEDNQAAICLAKDQQVHGRTKHIDIKYHFIRSLVHAGRIRIVYCASEDMVADMFTKGLPIKQFEKLRRLAGITEFPH